MTREQAIEQYQNITKEMIRIRVAMDVNSHKQSYQYLGIGSFQDLRSEKYRYEREIFPDLGMTKDEIKVVVDETYQLWKTLAPTLHQQSYDKLPFMEKLKRNLKRSWDETEIDKTWGAK